MKKIIYIITFLISLTIITAQTPTPELSRFNGGSMNLNISLASNWVHGKIIIKVSLTKISMENT